MTSDVFWTLVLVCFLVGVLWAMVKAPDEYRGIDEQDTPER